MTELNPFSKLFSEMNLKQLCEFQEKITHALVDFIASVLGRARNYLGLLCILYLPVKEERQTIHHEVRLGVYSVICDKQYLEFLQVSNLIHPIN